MLLGYKNEKNSLRLVLDKLKVLFELQSIEIAKLRKKMERQYAEIQEMEKEREKQRIRCEIRRLIDEELNANVVQPPYKHSRNKNHDQVSNVNIESNEI